MKIKVIESLQLEKALLELQELRLPFDTAYSISNLLEDIQKISKLFEKQRIELVKQLGEELEDGSYKVTKENESKYWEEVNILLEEEVEIESEIKFEDLQSKLQKVDISPSTVGVLKKVLK
jgi:hypothetical protein